ncbi:MAG: phosphate ABC transporter substrate-binding protein [Nitrospirota bacterium]
MPKLNGKKLNRHPWTLWTMATGLVSFLSMALLPGSAFAEHPGITQANPKVDPQVQAYSSTQELSGRLTIAGSDTMRPLLVKLAGEFTNYHPGVRIMVEGIGSREAIKSFVFGYSLQRRGEKARKGHNGASEVNLLASSRELTEKEIEAFASTNGYVPLAIPVATDAVTVYVHRDNPIEGMTLAQIDAIFGTARKRGYSEDIKTWGQAGLRDGWQRQPIHLYGRDSNSGTRDFFRTSALLDGDLKDEIKEMPGSASEILAIARDPLGIGYAGTGFQTSYVRAVPVAEDQGKPFVAPDRDSVLSGRYPLRRQLYLYVDSGDRNAVLDEFLKFVNSREGQQTVVRANLYPLSKGQIESNLAALEGGTKTASIPSGSSSN